LNPYGQVAGPSTYIKLDIGKTLAYTSFGIPNNSDIFNLALGAESSPKTLLNIRGDLVLFLLRSFSLSVGVQNSLIIDESQVTDKHTSAMISRTGMSNTVHSKVAFEHLGTVELGSSRAGSRRC
jgi:hypothetical protein